MVRFGFRVPSLRKRIAARTSLKRYVRNSLGLKAPRGWGWITNPRKAAYNRIYNRTTRGCVVVVAIGLAIPGGVLSLRIVSTHYSWTLTLRDCIRISNPLRLSP